jgi:membrane fusion protein (multidrug efflux system)
MTTNKKLWIAVIAGLLLVVAGLVAVKAGQIVKMINAGKAFVPPPESVTSARVEAAEWQPSKSAIGTLVALRGVTLGAELPGIVRAVGFDSGTYVRKGAVLVQLDVSTEEAQLASAQADAVLAKLNLERAQSLRKGEANTQAELDAADARYKQAAAQVESLRATIAKKTIRAPFDGRIAIRQVEIGQIVSPGTPLASLQSVDPVYAEFSLPQQALADLKVGQKARMHTDIFPGTTWEGAVSTINSEVDPSTRNVRVRATFPNRDGRLRPGMFANVEVLGSEKASILAIPATAVLFAPYGDSVYVIEEKKGADGKTSSVAQQKFVRLGERRGDVVAVISGLKAGETVVSSGAFKLRNGAAVVVRNDLAPKADVAPKPTDN